MTYVAAWPGNIASKDRPLVYTNRRTRRFSNILGYPTILQPTRLTTEVQEFLISLTVIGVRGVPRFDDRRLPA